jgi:hypothetical protein
MGKQETLSGNSKKYQIPQVLIPGKERRNLTIKI